MADNYTFKYDKYAGTPGVVDGSDALAEKGQVISFHHLPTKKSVYFKAFITAFNETYSPDWAAETVYGRADPIYLYKNTVRKISLAFKVPAASNGEAYENLAKVQTLLQFLYPTYVDLSSDPENDNANTITQSPLVRLKVMNLLQASTTSGVTADQNAASIYSDYKSSGDAADKGLLGVLESVTVNHNLDNPDYGAIEKGPNTVLPKLIEINLGFSVIHEHPVGWSESKLGEFVENISFPYGALEADPNASSAGAANEASESETETSPANIEDPQEKSALEDPKDMEKMDSASTSETATEADKKADRVASGLPGQIKEPAKIIQVFYDFLTGIA